MLTPPPCTKNRKNDQRGDGTLQEFKWRLMHAYVLRTREPNQKGQRRLIHGGDGTLQEFEPCVMHAYPLCTQESNQTGQRRRLHGGDGTLQEFEWRVMHAYMMKLRPLRCTSSICRPIGALTTPMGIQKESGPTS